ncbi:hypothetical protein G6F48_011150 [Rhizopus delemar]|nr:hypothetical protein G6F48_011150 [Rhizopus delemar]
MMRNDYVQGTNRKSRNTEYTREQLLSYAKCFTTDITTSPSTLTKTMDIISSIPSAFIRYGILFPLRCLSLSTSTVAFFTALPVAVTFKSDKLVSLSVKYYCKAILLSLGVKVNYIGNKPTLDSPHVFVANHTSYLDYILLSAHQFPHAVVMARHGGALGFLQNNGLNYLHSLTFDRSNVTERKDLSESLRKHVKAPENRGNPMIIFPEGTCVNNRYVIRFQKGAFELGVKVCPVGIKYYNTFGDPYWDTRKGFMHYAYYRMTRWITPVDVIYCEPQSPKEDEDAVEYSDRVKEIIASSAELEQVDFNGMAKRELLNVSKRGKRALRKEGERYDERNIIPTVKWGGGGAMVWGCFWGGGFGPLEIIDTSSVDQETYISILTNRFHPWFTNATLHQERDFIFQEDGASFHIDGYARWWKEPHQIRSFEQIERKRSLVKNLEQLKVVVQEESERMDDEFADQLVRSMKRRCEAVIKAKGGITEY